MTDGTYTNLVAITSINAIAILPTVMLNALVLIAVATKPRLRTPSNRLLTSMAGTDLFAGLVVQPLAIAVQVKRIRGDGPSCTLESVYVIFRFSAVFIACSLLVLIAVDRYIAVKKPLRYRHIVTKKRIKIAVTFLLAINAFSLIMDIVLAVVEIEIELYIAYYKAIDVTMGVIGLLYIVIIGYTYGYIYSQSRRQKKRLKNDQLSHEEAEQVQKDNKAAHTLILLLGVIVLTHLPGIITMAVSASSGFAIAPHVMSIAWTWARTIIALNVLFNPLIYCWRFKNLRHAFLEVLHLREPENRPSEIEMAVIRRQRPEVQPTSSEAFSMSFIRKQPVLLSFRRLDSGEIVPIEEINSS